MDYPTPLAAYIAAQNLTERAFAELLSESRGYRVHQSTVSGWVTGSRPAGVMARYQIERATSGAVPADAWPHLRK